MSDQSDSTCASATLKEGKPTTTKFELAANLRASRIITQEMLAHCSDPIRNFYQAVENIDYAKESVLGQMIQASENLLYTEVHTELRHDDEDPEPPIPRLVPTSFWIQIICKMFHVWDFHSLPKHLQNHFLHVNETTVGWIEKLENCFGELGRLIKSFKDDFNAFHDYVEMMHGFSTWVQRKFNFDLPDEVASKWKRQLQLEQENMFNDEMSEISTLQLNFCAFDMDVVELKRDEQQTSTYRLSLNKTGGNVQLGIASTFFAFLDNIVRRAIVNLNSAISIFRKNMIVKTLKVALAFDMKLSNLRHINQLEDLVLALTFEWNHRIIKETIAYIDLLDRSIAQVNQLFQTVQLQLEDRGIIPTTTGSRKDRIRKKVLQNDEEQLNPDVWMDETKQILRDTVEAMPNSYEIQEDSLNRSLMKWVEMADKDMRLKENFRKHTKMTTADVSTVPKVDDDNSGEVQKENSYEVIEVKQKDDNPAEVRMETLPINFEQAMMHTTLGKAFFPDPDQFHSDIEIWRAVCFKMLATALDKFRELTASKIIATKKILSQPILSSPPPPASSVVPSLEDDDLKLSGKERPVVETTDSSSAQDVKAAPVSDAKNINSNNIETKTKSPVPNVGYTEGLSSILCLIAGKLSPKDRPLVSGSRLKELKKKFYTATKLVEKFKKDLDSTERILVNSLSLAMASVEYKHLPHHLPVSPLDNDYLKAHDLEEVGSRMDLTKSKDDESLTFSPDVYVWWKRDAQTVQSPISQSNTEFISPHVVELNWDSTHKTKLMCRVLNSENPQWFEFSQLHIEGQIRLIHMLLDAIVEEFEKARDFLKWSRADFLIAKKILLKTWKGIWKDNKKGRIPDSGMLVLVKLYRHQITTAVVNMKQIRKNAKEVRYLLSLSAKKAKLWSKEDENFSIPLDKNYVTTLDNLVLNVILRARVPKNAWVIKTGPQLEQHNYIPRALYSTEDERFLDIKSAVVVKSSTSLDIPKEMMRDLSEIAVNKSLASFQNETTKRLGTSARDFASSLENLLLSGVEQSVAILRLPNCSMPQQEGVTLFEENIPNIVGVLAALASATVSIQHFKNIVPLQRTFITERIHDVEMKLNNVHHVETIDSLITELRKIRRSVEALDKKFREKFCFTNEFPAMKNMLIRPFQPYFGMSPMEFVEELATSASGHVWTIISGIPEVGTIVRHNKSFESHAISNIPLSSKLEILLCLIQFLEKIVEHVLSSINSLKKDVAIAKGLLKSHGKGVMKKKRLGTGKAAHLQIGTWNTNEMSKGQVEEHLQSFTRISNASKRAEEDIVMIIDLLKRASDMLQHVNTYLTLKMKLEPVSGVPTIDNDMIFRAQNWHTVETITGICPQPPKVTPPILLKKIVKKAQKEEGSQIRYKAACENKVLELEMFFEQFCRSHHVAVDVPLMFVPTTKRTHHAHNHA